MKRELEVSISVKVYLATTGNRANSATGMNDPHQIGDAIKISNKTE